MPIFGSTRTWTASSASPICTAPTRRPGVSRYWSTPQGSTVTSLLALSTAATSAASEARMGAPFSTMLSGSGIASDEVITGGGR